MVHSVVAKVLLCRFARVLWVIDRVPRMVARSRCLG